MTGGFFARGLALLALAGVLAACSGAPHGDGADRLDGAALSSAAMAPEGEQDGRQRAGRGNAQPAAIAIRPAARLGDIVNRPPPAVEAALGPPDLARREAPAEVWQYTGRHCILDVTFYPTDGAQTGDGALRAAYLEGRALDGATMAPADCLRGLERPMSPAAALSDRTD